MEDTAVKPVKSTEEAAWGPESRHRALPEAEERPQDNIGSGKTFSAACRGMTCQEPRKDRHAGRDVGLDRKASME
jgi:hypothetical protein